MGKGKHPEAQIIAALKQVEAGPTAEEVARENVRVQARGLRLESKVWRAGNERGAAAQATGR